MSGYTEYTDAKGRNARLIVEANRAERARMRRIEQCPAFDGTLYMSKHELREARLSGLGMAREAGGTKE